MSNPATTMVLLPYWKPLFPLLLLASGFFFEEWISFPSCRVVPNANPYQFPHHYVADKETDTEADLKVMLVANLLLLGSDTTFFNSYFREYYLSKFFKKSFYSVKPDLLVVLGDLSARGSELTKVKWMSLFAQFYKMLGPFLEHPFHLVVGDRDVGKCDEADEYSVYWLSRSVSGLDSSGCGGFQISNMSFVSLNSVALLCGNSELRFGVEKSIEMERFGQSSGSGSNSGPVLLLHFPLHRTGNSSCNGGNIFLKSSGLLGAAPYDLTHTVPLNATEYIFQALKPSIIFSAHTHEFCDHIHSDGTREVTVPSMTWKARDDPGFVVANFRSGTNAVSVSYCSLARESHVLLVYSVFGALFLAIFLLTSTSLLWGLQ